MKNAWSKHRQSASLGESPTMKCSTDNQKLGLIHFYQQSEKRGSGEAFVSETWRKVSEEEEEEALNRKKLRHLTPSEVFSGQTTSTKPHLVLVLSESIEMLLIHK